MIISKQNFKKSCELYRENVSKPKNQILKAKTNGWAPFLSLSIGVSISLLVGFGFLAVLIYCKSMKDIHTYLLPTLIATVCSYSLAMPFLSVMESSLEGLTGCMMNDEKLKENSKV